MHHQQHVWLRLASLFALLTVLLAPGGASGMPVGDSPLSTSAMPLLGEAASWFSAPSSSSPPRAVAAQRTPVGAGNPLLLGDINSDGIVDLLDYGAWRMAFGVMTCGNAADLNADCIVDVRDYGIWRANFGHTLGPPTPSVGGTPSPTSTTLGAASPMPTITTLTGATPTATTTVLAGTTPTRTPTPT